MLTRRTLLAYSFVIVLILSVVLAGGGRQEMGLALTQPAPSLTLSPSPQPTAEPTVQSTVTATVEVTARPTLRPTFTPTPTPSILGKAYDTEIDIMAGPVELPLELQIPALKVKAPIMGVGLTSKNVMDAPKGPIGDPLWHTAFWYRGGSIPGEPGTATIAGHVSNMEGESEIFAYIWDLQPGDLIIIRVKNTLTEIHFIVDQVEVYSILESSDPAVLARIFGSGPMAGTGPRPTRDGLSHLTLITCAGSYSNGLFDHHAVVYATRIVQEGETPDEYSQLLTRISRFLTK